MFLTMCECELKSIFIRLVFSLFSFSINNCGGLQLHHYVKLRICLKKGVRWATGLPDYRAALLGANVLRICYLHYYDLVFFFKLWNGYFDVDVSAFLSFALGNSGLRSSSYGYFITQPGRKLKTDNSYYHRITKMSNYLFRKGFITFSMSLQKSGWKL